MAGEKNFENRLKKWLEAEGIYPLGEPVDRMSAPPCGFYEKRWGGSRYVKSGLHIPEYPQIPVKPPSRFKIPFTLSAIPLS